MTYDFACIENFFSKANAGLSPKPCVSMFSECRRVRRRPRRLGSSEDVCYFRHESYPLPLFSHVDYAMVMELNIQPQRAMPKVVHMHPLLGVRTHILTFAVLLVLCLSQSSAFPNL